MTIIQKLNNLYRKRLNLSPFLDLQKTKFFNFNLITLFSLITVLSIILFIASNFIEQKNENKRNNFETITKSSEFSNLANYFISKLNSPYKEIKYSIQNNDSVEKILKKFNIDNDDIKEISVKLKQKKLTNIYTGRELNLILKKRENGSNTVVSILYPINNTSSIEVRKFKDNYIVKENILRLNKKEVVVKNIIKDNLYSSATSVNIEPNIIIEFARIFGFEVDFQRDIRKGDWFEIFYEKFEDDNGKVRDTGKIIYASMFVNNEEINLYNFNYKNDEEYYDIKGKSITKSLMKTL